MRIPHAGRTVLVIPMALVTVLLFAPIAIAAPALGVRGGGVVGGDPGVTSQLGFTATAHAAASCA